ncbi:hypothetical protein BRADI_2g42255v3 [Brachypodium distachyon]|uniref:Uncharacterized protein n=1 Tax=Brachypodium distachyon TaxID=15368 RepID=A0A0Q3MW13_BRADI|nr:hypothetical protein BRADI_2g42255v3 [Brachypodium distachyon]
MKNTSRCGGRGGSDASRLRGSQTARSSGSGHEAADGEGLRRAGGERRRRGTAGGSGSGRSGSTDLKHLGGAFGWLRAEDPGRGRGGDAEDGEAVVAEEEGRESGKERGREENGSDARSAVLT